jgi:Domain of unknown function (DUF4266)
MKTHACPPGIPVALLAIACLTSACSTVRPAERAVLADPTMQFDGEPHHTAALHHAVDNREGSIGGNGVSGGGCGCN